MTSPRIHLRLEYLVKNKSMSDSAILYEEAIDLDIHKLLVGPPTLPDSENVLGLAIKDPGDEDETGRYTLFRVQRLRLLCQQETEKFDFEVDDDADILLRLLKITWIELDAVDGPFTVCYRIDDDFKVDSVPDHADPPYEWLFLVMRQSGDGDATYVLLFVMDEGAGDKPTDDCDQARAMLKDLQTNSPGKKLKIKKARQNCLVACAEHVE